MRPRGPQPLEHCYEKRGEQANEGEHYGDEEQTDATPDSADLVPELLSEAPRLFLEHVDPTPDRQADRFYQVIQSLVQFRPERPHFVHGPFRPWGHGCEATKRSPCAGALRLIAAKQ